MSCHAHTSTCMRFASRLRARASSMTHFTTSNSTSASNSGRRQRRRRRRHQSYRSFLMATSTYMTMYAAALLVIALVLSFPPSSATSAAATKNDATEPELIDPPKPNGDPRCPCLSAQQLEPTSVILSERKDGYHNKGFDYNATIGSLMDPTSYGVGCRPHDAQTATCRNGPSSSGGDGDGNGEDGSSSDCETTVPRPSNCDQEEWCSRSFCYVDPDECDLLHRPSLYYRHRYYSYATCGFMDYWTASKRVESLRGDTLRVAYNSNTGGWKGATNVDGSFAINNMWRGPIVEFMNNAAFRGGFTLNVTAPPPWLRDGSQRFFGSSSFDYCVYAASLGYVDLCVAAYSITDKRAAVTTFFETSDDPIYLITFTDSGDSTSWSSFTEEFGKIFAPFTGAAWAMIVLLSLPLLGLLMMYHEYGSPGSAYPRTAPYLVTNEDGTEMIRNRNVPKIKHIGRSLYMAALSFFQESYDQSVVTMSGKIHLLAISSLVYLVLAVYTANLAAILTSDNLSSPVDSIEAAVLAGFNICSERKVMEMVLNRYDLDESLIVPDPISLGGDGKPGFTCSNCKSRTRVFDMMRRTHSDRWMYCNAAFALREDLEALNGKGLHCDKIRVGDAVAHDSTGIPIYDGIADGLTALLHDMKNDGLLNKEYGFSMPAVQCAETGGEGSSLTVKQLTGIWMISFSFAFAALIAKWVSSCSTKRQKGPRYHALYRSDQWGKPCDNVIIKGRRFDQSKHDLVDVTDHRRPSRPGSSAERSSVDGHIAASEQYYDAHATELKLSAEGTSGSHGYPEDGSGESGRPRDDRSSVSVDDFRDDR
mmetsp:Transcript_11479/g.25728  ORF Transcript_11479/g.25728 Transcript_11479/m.25728 type:complete len:818 (-) Transcript_11479:238-2691(-)